MRALRKDCLNLAEPTIFAKEKKSALKIIHNLTFFVTFRCQQKFVTLYAGTIRSSI